MMPITMASEGDRVRIVRITGRDETKAHLRDLGFVENTEITLVSKNGGSLILQVRDARIALGESMARRIMF